MRTKSSGFLIASGVLMLAALVLAGWRLGSQSLWVDETYTWWFTRLHWPDLLQAARIDAVNPPLYYIYVRLFSPSGSEAPLRLPSVVAHVAGTAGAIWLGLHLGGRAGGFASGLLWATHPMLLWAARDARPYALAAALAVVLVAVFVRIRDSWSARLAAAAGAAMALGLITHYFFFVTVASLSLMSAVNLRHSPTFFRRWTLLTLAAMAPLALWVVWLLRTGSPSLGIGWIRTPVLADVPLTLWNLAGGYAGVVDLPSTLLGLSILASMVLGLRSDGRAAWSLLVGGLLAPALAVWVISQRRPVYVDRYFIVLLPFVAAMVALGVNGLRHRIRRGSLSPVTSAGLALAACLVALAASATVHVSPKFAKEDWRGLAGFLRSHAVTVRSLRLSEPEITLPLTYYFDRDLMAEGFQGPRACGQECWLVSRQPYTATHAFTQSIADPSRPRTPEWPAGCRTGTSWVSPTGIQAWELSCP
ncbi:MAG TPA: hypothetical protein VLD63_13060 [Anaerolineales bacterium]|nr:hypothetical protein [Anaerolineales bacterium]